MTPRGLEDERDPGDYEGDQPQGPGPADPDRIRRSDGPVRADPRESQHRYFR